MIPLFGPTIWQAYPASCRDIVDFLNSLDLSDEELNRGLEYLQSAQNSNDGFCIANGCLGIEHARGLCFNHYRKVLYREKNPPKLPKTCTIDGCETKAICRGMCQSHYNKMMYAARTAKQ